MSRRTHGFSLIEMLAALSLMVVVAAFAGHLYLRSVTLQGAAQDAEWATSRATLVLRELQRDVWNALEVSVENDRFAALFTPDGGEVTWTYLGREGEDDPLRLRRETVGADAGLSSTVEYELPAALRFTSVERGKLEVRIEEHHVTLVSQVVRLNPGHRRKGGAS